jgi:hypothetical protein
VKLCHERVSRIVPEDSSVRCTTTRRSRGVGTSRRGGREEPLRLGNLTSQGVGRFALVLPHEGGCPHPGLPLRGGGTRGDESSGERRGVTAIIGLRAGVDLGEEWRCRGRESGGTGGKVVAGVRPGAGKVDGVGGAL